MEVGAIQSRRLRGKNEIHSSSERDLSACGGTGKEGNEGGRERARVQRGAIARTERVGLKRR